ncbi:hypothetical protein Tsubulata_016595 [Turnera subulata]|uniref:Pentatricopeptide repeat-containing protein n=1 Tax=Turnera subulata TaxID=218843 RepID=A0A9Q0G5P1_9ROSI|nr:hypothetical protein Tsubulata_016595 [Turnera subulata]
MSGKRLLSTHSFPPVAKHFLHWAQNAPPTIHPSNPQSKARNPSILATGLIKSYFQNGQITEARILFDELPERDVVAWTSMIAGYTSCNENALAWNMFCDMVKNGDDPPNSYTMSSVLKACKGMKCLSCGGLAHGLAVKSGFLDGFVYVENALMDMYATCSVSMEDAYMVFSGIREKNAVSWTTLVTGYTHRGNGHRALQIFRQMLLEEAELNPYTISIVVRACTSIGSQIYGKQIHTAVIKHGFGTNLPVMNSVLDMYCRCGCLWEGERYFHEMSQKDLISWNTLISGYERSNSIESLVIFSKMELEGFSPNCFTFTSLVAACANLAALHCGQQVHGGIICRGLDGNSALANALIDMYAKCGNVTDSRKIFNDMPCKNLVSWTSMMIGYGAHGFGKQAVELFDEMVISGIIPDQIVFMAVLSACSHAGLVDQGLKYFNCMTDDYSIKPNQEIYGCVVDLLGRAGRVEEAYRLIRRMPFNADASVWGALLGACKAHNFPKLGILAAQRILDLEPNLVGTYVVLSNFYALEGKWGEFARTRKSMRDIGSKKEAGRSWIEIRNQVYSFVVGDKVGSHIQLVYQVMEVLILHMKEAGYLGDMDCLIHDTNDVT